VVVSREEIVGKGPHMSIKRKKKCDAKKIRKQKSEKKTRSEKKPALRRTHSSERKAERNFVH